MIPYQRFDQATYDDMVARKGILAKEVDEIASKLWDTAETDAPADSVSDKDREKLYMEHGAKQKDLHSLEMRIDQMGSWKPRDMKKQMSPMAMFAADVSLDRIPEAIRKHNIVTGLDGATLAGKANVLLNMAVKEHTIDGEVPQGMPIFTPNDFDQIGRDLPIGSHGHECIVEVIDHYREGVPQNTLTSDTSPGGEDWTPLRVRPVLMDTLLFFGNMQGMVTNWVTPYTSDAKQPVLNDSAEEGEYQGQGVAASVQDLQNLDEKTISTARIGSKAVYASLEFGMDTPFNTDNVILTRLRRRLARGTNAALVGGAGTDGMPKGFTIDAAKTDILANTALTSDEINNLKYRPDWAYLEGEGSPMGLDPPMGSTYKGFVSHQKIQNVVYNIKDDDGRYQWRPGYGDLTQGIPGMLAGFPYVLNNKMHDAINSAGAILAFGNFGYYIYRRVSLRVIVRFYSSPEILSGRRGYVGFEWNGGRFIGGFKDVTMDESEAVQTIQGK